MTRVISTGKTYDVPIENGAVNASLFKQMQTGDEVGSDAGLVVYDPAYTNTAVCRSSICFIDGDRGILRYRGARLAPCPPPLGRQDYEGALELVPGHPAALLQRSRSGRGRQYHDLQSGVADRRQDDAGCGAQ